MAPKTPGPGRPRPYPAAQRAQPAAPVAARPTGGHALEMRSTARTRTVYAPAANLHPEGGLWQKISTKLRYPRTRRPRRRRPRDLDDGRPRRCGRPTWSTTTTWRRRPRTTCVDDEVDADDEVDVEALVAEPAAVVDAVGRGGRGGRGRGEPDDEDVEASLDVILKERLVVEDEPEDDEVGRRRRPLGGDRAGAAQAARRVRLPVVLPGEAPEPAGRQEEDALPGLCLTHRRPEPRRRTAAPGAPTRRSADAARSLRLRAGRSRDARRGPPRAGGQGPGPARGAGAQRPCPRRASPSTFGPPGPRAAAWPADRSADRWSAIGGPERLDGHRRRRPRPARPAAPPDAGPATRPTAPDDLAAPLCDRAAEPVDLAIPDYDTLSASQVVRRLDGLGPGELEAVYRHEAATRGRRTILHRAQQLLGTEDAARRRGP